ncbi:hypothetical protein Vadar_025333 [Vaccinium darrowii]|uniref:Uncharacterized protein n=1 Tax=Vaccinium darrowii TaxID=229202 RepID=A0ACB7ZDT6_9ERIC|nr:hypothetical protein Vadar_025333 [Vaccinium darrowii]
MSDVFTLSLCHLEIRDVSKEVEASDTIHTTVVETWLRQKLMGLGFEDEGLFVKMASFDHKGTNSQDCNRATTHTLYNVCSRRVRVKHKGDNNIQPPLIEDEDAFFADYAEAHMKLSELGFAEA